MSTAADQVFQQIPCTELIKLYRPGGFHPVHLNDTFKNGRYRVVHKLGYGAFGTVWLVHDEISNQYASLKILAADISSSDSHSEVAVIQHLQQHATGNGKEYVVEVFDIFKHSGPNGLHDCIVMEVLGPPISSNIIEEIYDGLFPIEVAKQISAQIAHGLAYIHKAGIAHGDLHMSNILLHSSKISSWTSDSDFEKYLGAPYKQRLLKLQKTNELVAPSPHIPSYVVPVSDSDLFLRLCLCLSNPTEIRVKICDFGEALIPSMQLNPLPRGTPVVYSAPEAIFGDPTGLPADIWSLAVIICLIISGDVLFPSYYGIRKEVIKSMVLALGKLPERWWSSWEERGEWFNENGEWCKDGRNMFQDSLDFSEFEMEEEEIPAFEEIIRRMVRYNPGERASIDEVIEWMSQNAWFVN